MSCIWTQQLVYLTTKTFSDDCLKSIWQGLRPPVFCTTTNPRLKFFLFQLVCQKTKILHRIKFSQEISTKLLKRMHQLSINMLCSSDYQTTYSFCEIKHFLKQANSLYYFIFRGYFWKIWHVPSLFFLSWDFSKLYFLQIWFIISGWGDTGHLISGY